MYTVDQGIAWARKNPEVIHAIDSANGNWRRFLTRRPNKAKEVWAAYHWMKHELEQAKMTDEVIEPCIIELFRNSRESNAWGIATLILNNADSVLEETEV